MSTRNIVKPKYKTRNLISINDIPVATSEDNETLFDEFISKIKEVEIPGIGKTMFFTNYINLVTGELSDAVLGSLQGD